MWQVISKSLIHPIEAGEQVLENRNFRVVSGLVFFAGFIMAVVWYFGAFLPIKGPKPSVLLTSSLSTGLLWYGLWYGLSLAIHLVAKTFGGQGGLKETLIAIGLSMVYIFYTPVALIFAGTSVGRYLIGLCLFVSLTAAVFWLCRVHRLGWVKGIGVLTLPILLLSLLAGALKAVFNLW